MRSETTDGQNNASDRPQRTDDLDLDKIAFLFDYRMTDDEGQNKIYELVAEMAAQNEKKK